FPSIRQPRLTALLLVIPLVLAPNAHSSFFFHYSGAHRDLHSFPTRRSSDLFAANSRPRAATSSPTPQSCVRRTRFRPSLRTRSRSEEHTSELQSPCNLVCRLLLEKKKKTRVKTLLICYPLSF